MKHGPGIALLLAFTLPAHALELGLPLSCTIGQDCFIQQYVDHGPAGAPQDYRCGHETYAGHNGTDFRVLSLDAAPVAVLAPADGTVLRTRDAVPDHILKTPADMDAIRTIECGNAVVIGHGDGWETQLCHLRLGSVRVHPGDAVKAGDAVGLVGASGAAAFAHVHITVRKDGQDIDPFSNGSGPLTCPAGDDPLARSLWKPELRAALGYHGIEIIDAGFAGQPPLQDMFEQSGSTIAPPRASSPQILVYMRLMHAGPGDAVQIIATGPGNWHLSATSPPYAAPLAVSSLVTGTPRKGDAPWPAGYYFGLATVLHNGSATGQKAFSVEIK